MQIRLQQYLPFTVLKLYGANVLVEPKNVEVATVLTVYGIETLEIFNHKNFNSFTVATVLTVYGIETLQYPSYQCFQF